MLGMIPNSSHLSDSDTHQIEDFLERVERSKIRDDDRETAVEQYRTLIFWFGELFDIGADWEVCLDLDMACKLAEAPQSFLALCEAMKDWQYGDMARLTRQLLYEIADLRKKLAALTREEGAENCDA